ncbi:MAG: hypothetical protein HY078_05085 [Elusimicrobia bacterium]|nr:hypothetical protein [Elusimicrobiota bacterium]
MAALVAFASFATFWLTCVFVVQTYYGLKMFAVANVGVSAGGVAVVLTSAAIGAYCAWATFNGVRMAGRLLKSEMEGREAWRFSIGSPIYACVFAPLAMLTFFLALSR